MNNTASDLQRRSARIDLGWAFLLVSTILTLSLATRTAPFTPDEPREFALSWSMLTQPNKAIPLLSGEAFCEKPPLTYWAASLSMAVFGTEVWSSRLPNLLWALLTVAALIAMTRPLAPTESQVRVGVLTALIAATAYLLFRVEIWLATDAPLLAGTAIALLGAWRGVSADERRRALGWFCVMHLGLALAFFAKNLLGWLVPVSSLVVWVVWQRRWRTLLHWELYAGLVLQALLIVPWIASVAHSDNGWEYLRIFLYDNTVGRLLPIETVEQYQLGHANHPGKYLEELGYYLLPWTFATVGALRWTVMQLRTRGRYASYLKFLIAGIVPGLLFLSLATTARDVYCAPVMLGLATLTALWLSEGRRNDSRFDRICTALTIGSMVLLAFVIGTLALAIPLIQGLWTTSPAKWFAGSMAIALLLLAVKRWRGRWPDLRALLSAFAAYGIATIVVSVALFPALDTTQDLRPIARAVARDFADSRVGVLRNDETMRAYLDFGAGIRAENFRGLPEAVGWLKTSANRVFVVELYSDHLTPAARSRLATAFPKLADAIRIDRNRQIDAFRAANISLLAQYSVKGGRTYGVWGDMTKINEVNSALNP